MNQMSLFWQFTTAQRDQLSLKLLIYIKNN
jgi:hypothetical protein